MEQRFLNRTVLITGAAGALGQTMSKAFAAEGANVVVTARKENEGAALAKELGGKSIFVQLDVTNEENWAAAVAEVESKIGPISVLVNNAAYLAVGGTLTVPTAEWRKVIETNLTGDFLGIRAVYPSMKKNGSGSIVIVSSIAGLHGTPNLVAYGASKWGVRGLLRTAARELAPDKIRVNSIHPGIIDTPLARDPATGAELVPVGAFPIPRMASTEEITKYILFIASDDAAFSTGSEFLADGGFGLGPTA